MILENLIKKTVSYIKPKSVTWWVGVGSIAAGIVTGNNELIATGGGLIGLRTAISDMLKKINR